MTRPLSRSDFLQGDSLSSAVRILAAMVGFRKEFGDWPQKILMDSGMADGIREDVLTPAGWDLMASKFEIVKIDAGSVIAEGGGRTHEYGNSDYSADIFVEACTHIWGVDLYTC